MGATERTAGLWWGDRTALEDAPSAFFSLRCWFCPLVDGVTGWELPTVLGFLRFCFSEEMPHFVQSLTCWLSPASRVVTEGLWSLYRRQHLSLDSPRRGLLVGHPGRLGRAWEICTWVFRLHPDTSLQYIDFRITEETVCELGSPLSAFGKSPVLLGKQFLAWD